jgi:hypothetical protein
MLRLFAVSVGLMCLSVAGSAGAEEKAKPGKTVCELIETAANDHRLPIDFFTRLIWKESRFRADAVSPKGARGIAQFMPGTAALRGLSDSFDPIEAIPASANYLAALAARFGNLGLAAAAYNAGEKRVDDWLSGAGRLPFETEDYVLSITGRSVDDWAKLVPNVVAGATPLPKPPKGNCVAMAARLQKEGAGTEVVSAIPKAPRAPWGVQLAGNFSLNRAMASYRAVQKRFPAIVGDGPPMVLRSVMRNMGRAPVFQLRVPAQTREAADTICRRLRDAGGACVVLKSGA